MNKYQEALRKVKFIIDDEWGNGVSDENEDIQVLQELVEKETPKKPIKNEHIVMEEHIKTKIEYECPHCHAPECRRLEHNCCTYFIINERCNKCGGLLDWSQE